MNKEKKCLIAISTLMQFVFTFFDIFYGIYVYDISSNLNIIILYTIVNWLTFYLIGFLFYRFLNKKLISVLYKMSFLLGLISIGLTFTISSNRIYMVFVTQMFLKFTHFCYYLPHEVATMNANSKSDMKKFLGLSSTLSLISGFMSPFLSGLIIDYASYYIIFGTLFIITIITFILSFQVDIIKTNTRLYGLGKFIKDVHKSKGACYGYISHMFFKMSNDGIIVQFLPILIFLKTGTNFSVGLYSALASVLSGIALIIYCYFSKNKKFAMWVCTIFQIVASLSIIIWNSIVVFFIYYFVKKITTKILQNGSNEMIFSIIHNTTLAEYKIENFYTYNFYNSFGIIFNCLVGLIVYNALQNVVAITILLAVFSLIQIIATLFLNKSDKLLSANVSENTENVEILENNNSKI